MKLVRRKYYLILVTYCLVLLTATFGAWWWTKNTAKNRTQELFLEQTLGIEHWLVDKFRMYEVLIYGIEGFLADSQEISQDDWTKYIEKLRIEDRFGAITSIAYSKKQDDDFVITYLYPTSRISAVGYELNQEIKRKETTDKAIENNKPTITDKVFLVSDNEEGFIIMYPVYLDEEMPTEIKDRREVVDGIITMTFKSETLFIDLFGSVDPYPSIDFELYWGEIIEDDHLLYDHDKSFYLKRSDDDNRLQIRRKFNFGNNAFSLLAESKPGFRLSIMQERLPEYVLIFGIVVSILVFLYFRERIERLTDKNRMYRE